MEVSREVGPSELQPIRTANYEIDWDTYASQYDLLATNNPSYRENIEILRDAVSRMHLPVGAAICDVGAGTGNFICALARDIPSARFVHLDADPVMNEIARDKYVAAGIKHVDLHHCLANEATYPSETFDLIICVNALYAIYPQQELLRRIRGWLKPSGKFVVIDFGRQAKILDWAKYILGNILREKGLKECLRFLRRSTESLRQNRRGSKGQADGTYWLHTTEEFGEALVRAGFEVEELRACYRGYCDLAICSARQP